MSKSKSALMANTPFNPIPIDVKKRTKVDNRVCENTLSAEIECLQQVAKNSPTPLPKIIIPRTFSENSPPWLDFDPAEAACFLRLKDVTRLTGLAKSTVYLHMSQGKFPPSRKLNGQTVAIWDNREIQAYIRFQLKQS